MRTPAGGSRGYSLIEVMMSVTIITIVAAAAIPGVLANIDDARAYGAAWYVSTRLQRARMEAVVRSTRVGVRVVAAAGGFELTTYVDGNRNGIRTADIQQGVDRPLGLAERLPSLFRGVDFGVAPGVPAVDGGPPPGSDPIKLGSSNIVTFAPAGTSSAGSLYIRGVRNAQYVVRILGETGKTRVLKFDARTRRWNQI